MKAQLITFGPWQIPMAVKHALCSDGKRRYARITCSEPDTYFSIRASVNVKGKTVSGFITGDDGDYHFIAVQTGKNHDLLPGMPRAHWDTD